MLTITLHVYCPLQIMVWSLLHRRSEAGAVLVVSVEFLQIYAGKPKNFGV